MKQQVNPDTFSTDRGKQRTECAEGGRWARALLCVYVCVCGGERTEDWAKMADARNVGNVLLGNLWSTDVFLDNF
jgi:hypothetical protein